MRNIALAFLLATATALAAHGPSLARDVAIETPASRAGFDPAKPNAIVPGSRATSTREGYRARWS